MAYNTCTCPKYKSLHTISNRTAFLPLEKRIAQLFVPELFRDFSGIFLMSLTCNQYFEYVNILVLSISIQEDGIKVSFRSNKMVNKIDYL